MVHESVLLRNFISYRDIEVDKVKIEVVEYLPSPNCVKGVTSFLRHVGFYCRFIKHFYKITKPLTLLFAKDTPFVLLMSVLKHFTG